jgi:replicative DNA helicase
LFQMTKTNFNLERKNLTLIYSTIQNCYEKSQPTKKYTLKKHTSQRCKQFF